MGDTVKIPLSGKIGAGLIALVDPEDADLAALLWRRHSGGYATHNFWIRKSQSRKTVYLHRVIMARVVGEAALYGVEVDHRNLDKLDCRRHNLRLATDAQNSRNQTRTGSSGYRGVSFDKHKGRWRAVVCGGGKRLVSRYFRRIEDAIEFRNRKAQEFFGEFAPKSLVASLPYEGQV